MRAIIVGAGIAGLCLAKGLRLLGWAVDIYEQAPKLEPVGAGISLSANALKGLQRLGLDRSVIAQAQVVRRLSVLDQSGGVLHSTETAESRNGLPDMVVLHRGALQEALSADLPAGTIRTGRECVAARPAAGDRVEVAFKNGQRLVADVVFACDGIHSALRTALFARPREHFADYTCWRGIAGRLPAAMDPSHVTESWGSGIRFGLAPLRDGRVYWFACSRAERPDDPALAQVGLAALRHMFAHFHAPIPEILATTPPETLIRTDIFDLDPMPSFVKGRAVLLGDAAHAVTPDLGQGAGLAIEDAAILSALLGRNEIASAFRQYDAARVARARKIILSSRRFGRIAQWRHPLLVALRNRLMRAIPARLMEQQIESITNIDLQPIKRPICELPPPGARSEG